MCIVIHRSTILFCLNRTTNADGRCPGLITKEMFIAGVYRLHFETALYWESMGETCFYPYVEVRKKLPFLVVVLLCLLVMVLYLCYLISYLVSCFNISHACYQSYKSFTCNC